MNGISLTKELNNEFIGTEFLIKYNIYLVVKYLIKYNFLSLKNNNIETGQSVTP